ncbi:nucleoside recognition domain-containing protein [Roseivirga seohaensis]|uniref:nucleoside recognition domain-containing protein n=1 Tax=Roseivirga seohaensis TaxID=1914963 RepID=UPI003BAA695C
MALNYIWVAFFLIAFVVALIKLIFFGDTEVFPTMMQSTFDMAKTGFDLSIGLTGVLCLWLGIMKIGERGGIVAIVAKFISPLFTKIYPEIPKNHPVFSPMVMNFSMNFLGLDNAATPLGLKAMDGLQELNPNKDTASNAQIMFLVLNTSGLTLIPVSIMAYRALAGAANPSDIFLPILLATYFSTLAGLITVSIYQRINLFNKTVLLYLGTLTAGIIGLILYFNTISQDQIQVISSISSNLILFSIIISFIILALKKKVNVYESFVEGAKEGFSIAIKIIPYLVAMLVAIGVFRESGTLDLITDGLKFGFSFIGVNTEFIDALPTALMKPLSGSGSRSMMVETMNTFGADSFAGRLSSVFQGSTETTLYVLAVYFGSVNIKNSRYAVTAGLIADLVGVIAAIFIAYLFFY